MRECVGCEGMGDEGVWGREGVRGLGMRECGGVRV